MGYKISDCIGSDAWCRSRFRSDIRCRSDCCTGATRQKSLLFRSYFVLFSLFDKISMYDIKIQSRLKYGFKIVSDCISSVSWFRFDCIGSVPDAWCRSSVLRFRSWLSTIICTRLIKAYIQAIKKALFSGLFGFMFDKIRIFDAWKCLFFGLFRALFFNFLKFIFKKCLFSGLFGFLNGSILQLLNQIKNGIGFWCLMPFIFMMFLW